MKKISLLTLFFTQLFFYTFSYADYSAQRCYGTRCIKSGSYSTLHGEYAFVAVSTDSGKTWTSKINADNMPCDAIRKDQFSILYLGGCDNNFCMAAGSYKTDNGYSPLLVVSGDHGNTWSYAVTSANLPFDATIDHIGELYISLDNPYIASGSYKTINGRYPLLIASTDKGKTWNYKITASTPLPSDALQIYQSSEVRLGECYGNICLAAGHYKTSNGRFPLLAVSKDNGNTWNYVLSSAQMPSDAIKFDQNAFLGPLFYKKNPWGIWGLYSSTMGRREMHAVSYDGGNTWQYESGDYWKH